MDKCVNCPLRGNNEICPAQSIGVARYCQLVDPDHPDYNPAYINELRRMVGAPPLEASIILEKPARPPSLLSQAKSFVTSTIQHAVTGFQTVSDAVFDKRLSICKTCEFFDPQAVRCLKCGCFLQVKARWASAECPIQKWLKEAPPPKRGCCGSGVN